MPSAFILGYTGEIGKELVKLCLQGKHFDKLILIGRREVEQYKDAPGVEQRAVDFDQIEKQTEPFSGCDVGYCCLGTTRGKAGKDGFVKVDHDYVVNAAKAAKEAGCKHFHLVTSMGSNANAWTLYAKTKGETENDVKNIGFNHVAVYRPGFLLCNREEPRIGEKVAHFALWPVMRLRPTLMSVPTTDVARAMLQHSLATLAAGPGDNNFVILENADIHESAAKYTEKSE